MRYLCTSQQNTAGQSHHYLIADSIYWSNAAIPHLVSEKTHHSHEPQNGINCFDDDVRTHFFDDVLIGDKKYTLNIDKTPSGYILKHGPTCYRINAESIIGPLDDLDPVLFFGPVTILNLALNRVYCLHASAFTLNNHTFIVMAASGTGKSTIARFMGQKAQAQRIADDILPVKVLNNHFTLLPKFPQLKLPPEQQYDGPNIDSNVVLLFADKSHQTTKLIPLTGIQVTKKLINHTVATKLFDNQRLSEHLKFCHQVSSQCRSFQLSYQQQPQSLSQLYDMLYEYC